MEARASSDSSQPSRDFKPAFASAMESADAIRARRISAIELLNLTFQRIDHHNATINAIVWQSREQALARARQADDMAETAIQGVSHVKVDVVTIP
jgi:Asp-tRNA(Asn)/Glu-tRNA(Gln) amidotransferase A subunit family amidase